MSKLTKTGKRCIIRLTELEELVVSLSIPGSARHSHCRGQGFDSPMLHKEISHPSWVADFFVQARNVRISCLDNAKHLRGERRKRCLGGAFAKGESDLSELTETSSGLLRQQGPLRRLRLQNRDPTPSFDLLILICLEFCGNLSDNKIHFLHMHLS